MDTQSKLSATTTNTRDIVNGFMKLSLEERGHTIDYLQQEELTEICILLNVLTSEMQDFIKRTQGDRIQEMINQLLEDFHYDSFRTIADELFIEKIAWYRIITLLAFSSECAYKAIETKEKVSQIIDWMCKYIDDNLINWINQQGGWSSVRDSDAARNSPSTSATSNDTARTSSLKHYLGAASVAAVSFFIGSGLYLCSKFAVQK